MRNRLGWVLALAGGLGWGVSVASAQLVACPDPDQCVKVSVGSAEGRVGDVVHVEVSFEQAPSDGATGGPDEIAAIAFTLHIPGLELADCSNPDANGITPAVEVPAAVADNYRVVIENTSCTDRDRCLCPGEGQQRDDFINVVVFGPKDLPEPGSGPIDIPLLPNGVLVGFDLRAVEAGTHTLHIFAETDDPSQFTKPQFGAFLSVGDKEAVDQTADRDAGESKVVITDGQVVVQGGLLACPCDCNLNGRVTGTEITICVRILANEEQLSACPPADSDNNGRVTGTDITRGVNALAQGPDCVPVEIRQ